MAVEIAAATDIDDVFGVEDATHFNIGSPLELEETQVNLNLRRLVERSSGVFGKSGTGKSFLTRIILAGVIQRDLAVNLIFDMHNDYGWEVADESGPKAKGLRQLFPSKVAIFTLDEDSSRRRNAKYDYVVTLGYDEIDPEDLAMLKTTMNLSDSMIDAAYTLRKKWGANWMQRVLDASPEELDNVTETSNITSASLTALTRRLQRFERFEFLRKEGALGDSVGKILEYIEQRKSVVLEFGRYGSALEAYILVANYLTRRIHETYVKRVEQSLGDASLEPPQLLITIEEAHMLDNERDITAVLTGINGASGLREVLARLDTKQQAIIMGHAVPMPVVVKTRPYDTDFYRDVSTVPDADLPMAADEARRKLGNSGKRRLG